MARLKTLRANVTAGSDFSLYVDYTFYVTDYHFSGSGLFWTIDAILYGVSAKSPLKFMCNKFLFAFHLVG